MKGLFNALREDHARLEALFDTLLNAAHVRDAVATQEAWTDFERALNLHLEAEELHMLPIFDRVDPAEAHRIRTEHQTIRSLLADIGVEVDLHLVGEEKVTEFVRFLRAHAAREESWLYAWADQELPISPSIAVLEHVGAVVRAGISAIRGFASEDRVL
jgi:hemerythrin superfamily protein